MTAAASPSLADRVRHAMDRYGVTSSDIATQVGITPNLLARWLHQEWMAKHSHHSSSQQPSEIDHLLPQLEQRMARWITRVTSRAKRSHPRIAAPRDDGNAVTASEFIFPLRLELTVLQPSQYKWGASVASLCDNLLWDVRSRLNPRDFLKQTLRDLNVDQPDVWIGPLEKLMVNQIEEHKQKLLTCATSGAVELPQPAEPSPIPMKLLLLSAILRPGSSVCRWTSSTTMFVSAIAVSSGTSNIRTLTRMHLA